MGKEAMNPLGLALKDYSDGEKDAVFKLIRNDGKVFEIPVSTFFRNELFSLEEKALDFCRGKILVVGAGTGIHSLLLQGKGMDVTALEILPEACEIMRQNGQGEIICTDFFEFNPSGFDTIFMLGRNIGIVETLQGLDKFLKNLYNLLSIESRIILNSWDIQNSSHPDDLAYQEKNRRDGKYFGEIRNTIEYQKIAGKEFGWLYIDPKTLKNRAEFFGFEYTLIQQEDDGNFLAILEK